MPKPVPATELDAILEVLRRFPDGASVSEIAPALSSPLPLRSLQRHLERLVAQRRLLREGAGRGSRYRLPNAETPIPPVEAPQPAVQIPVSAEGEIVRAAVRAPIHERHPVGYKRAFLDAYRPNETAYLPPDVRQRLANAGTSPEGELPAGTYARHIYNRLLIDLSWNSSRLEGNTTRCWKRSACLRSARARRGKMRAMRK